MDLRLRMISDLVCSARPEARLRQEYLRCSSLMSFVTPESWFCDYRCHWLSCLRWILGRRFIWSARREWLPSQKLKNMIDLDAFRSRQPARSCSQLLKSPRLLEAVCSCSTLRSSSKLFEALRNSSRTLEVVRSRLKFFKAPRGCSKLFEDVKMFGAEIICPKLVGIVWKCLALFEIIWRFS